MLQKNFYFLARRFVAGESIDSAIAAVRALNSAGMSATLDFLGEDVFERDAAVRTRDVYLEMLDAIRASGIDSNVSVKLTAIGLLIDEDFATANLRSIVDHAASNPDPFVRIDMEGSAVTAATLSVFERVFAGAKNVGPVLQAYLKRTAGDVDRAIALGARVRLCKGAYSEPPEIAYNDMPEIRRNYLDLAPAAVGARQLPGDRHPRPAADRGGQTVRRRTRNCQRSLRISNALRMPAARSARDRPRGLPVAHLRALRNALGRVLLSSRLGTARERALRALVDLLALMPR